MVEHRDKHEATGVNDKGRHRLTCHHCDYTTAYPQKCPSCEVEDKLAACGPGIERLDEEVARLFPKARRAMLASDIQTSLEEVQNTVNAVSEGKIDVLIGTQIIAKGYHFPKLTTVGVIDGDLGLQGGDMRAAERTFQLLYQVAGRSGRAADKGHVFIQTTQPTHAVMQCLKNHDRGKLINTIIKERETYAMPPFSRLASISISGTKEDSVVAAAELLAQHIPQTKGFQVFGPAPANMMWRRGRHRQRFLIKCSRNDKIQLFIAAWLEKVKISKTLRLHIDIDPQSFS
jgi:primosomal protein N' (replication factor Y)